MLRRVFSCVCGILLMSLVMYGQLPTSTLNGTVTDPQDAVVTNAKVTATHTATGLARATNTDPQGFYSFTDLGVGTYSLKVEAPSFASSEVKGIGLEVGKASTVNVKLSVAKAGEVVTVQATETAVELTQSEVQGVVESSTIESLPLNGRNFLELAYLIPGNRPTPRFDPTKTNTLEVSSAGSYGRGGNILVDGADNNDEVVGGTLMNFPEDGIAEFQIATNKYTAEVGRSSSSIINIATKSGTNTVHGSEYFYFRHKALQGLPATFDRRQPTPRFAREQFGGSLGGPFVKDKLFGFLSMEYLNQDHAVPTGVRDFTTNTVIGGSALAFVHDFRLTSKFDWVPNDKEHVSVRYSFNRSLDVDNGFLVQPFGGAANRQQSLNRYNSVTANWSHTFSTHQINTLIYQKNYFINAIPFFSPNDPVTNPGGLALGNEIRFPDLQDGANYRIPQRTRLARDQIRDTFYWSSGNHQVSFGGEYQHYGSDIFFDLFGSGSIFATQDFGTRDLNGDGVINDLDIPIALALKSAATCEATSQCGFTSGAPGQPAGPFVHNNYVGLFVQDDWRILRNLTLNLGLRWDGDLNSLGETDQDKPCPSATAIDPNNPNCEFIRNLLGPHDSSAKYKNFGPRVGFAWDPFSEGKTVVRGGYGIYYDRVILEPAELEEVLNGRVLPLSAFGGSSCTAPGGSAVPSLANCSLAGAAFAPGSPTLASPFSGGFSPFGVGVNIIDNKAATPYVQQFTLGVQHQIAENYVVTVDGLHDRGYRQLVPRFLRVLPPGVSTPFIDCANGLDPCTVIDPSHGVSAAAGCPADPTCQQITDFQSVGRTWYDAMLVTFARKQGRGTWHPGYHISYTLSKTFDEQPDDQVSPSGKSTEDPSIVAMHVNNLRLEKGLATSDERHRFVLYGNMEIPWKVELSPIWTWSSHVPMDSVVSTLGGRLPNIPRNALGEQISDGAALDAAITAYNALPGCPPNGGIVPCKPAPGNLPLVDPKLQFGDDFNSFDMRLSRVFHFNERHSLQAIAEGFNLFNITNIRGTTNRNYSGFNNTIDSPDFNRPLETAGKFFGSGGPRAFQFALRYGF